MAPRETRIEGSTFGRLSGTASAQLRRELLRPAPEKTASPRAQALAKQQVRQAVADRAAKEAAKAALPTTTVDFVIHDEDDEPVSGARYVVTDAAWQKFEGTTDGSGAAHVDGLAIGPCRVSFPDYDRDDWWREEDGPPQPEPRVTQMDYFELVVTDEDGAPAAGLAFAATDENGVRHEGTTDAKGSARLEKVAQGEVRVVFPDVDASDWSS